MQEMNGRALLEIKEKEKVAIAAVSGGSTDDFNAQSKKSSACGDQNDSKQ